MSSKPVDYVEKGTLRNILPCQKLIPLRKGTTRGQIPQKFVPEESVNSDDVGNSAKPWLSNLVNVAISYRRQHPWIFSPGQCRDIILKTTFLNILTWSMSRYHTEDNIPEYSHLVNVVISYWRQHSWLSNLVNVAISYWRQHSWLSNLVNVVISYWRQHPWIFSPGQCRDIILKTTSLNILTWSMSRYHTEDNIPEYSHLVDVAISYRRQHPWIFSPGQCRDIILKTTSLNILTWSMSRYHTEDNIPEYSHLVNVAISYWRQHPWIFSPGQCRDIILKTTFLNILNLKKLNSLRLQLQIVYWTISVTK